MTTADLRLHVVQAELERLRAENARLREVLSFYADHDSYRRNAKGSNAVGRDQGNRARAALNAR